MDISAHIADENDISEFITNAKKLKLLNIWNAFNGVMPKNFLNHNLQLNSNFLPRAGFETNFFAFFTFFPPVEMIELGYTNPKFYYNVYSHIEKKYFEEYYELAEYENRKAIKELKEKMVSELLQINYSNYQKTENLPYAIRRLSIYKFHEIEDLLIDNIASNSELNKLNDPKWIFITGENGYGKTLLLQAITIGLNGDKEGNQILAHEGSFSLELKNNDKYTINSVDDLPDTIFTPFPHFVAYGPARLVKKPGYERDSKTASLFKPYSELIDIEERLIAWEKDRQQNIYYISAKNIILKLLKPQIEDIVIERDGTDTYVKYVEQNASYQKSFYELASGYRNIITMIGDLIIRLSKNQKEITDFTKLAGIVLIDEIDLHLHPKWQKAIVEILTDTFPNIQFIASTHSPIPILGAPKNTVILNVQRNENGITAKKLDVDFTKLLPNSLLSSPIFNFDELISKSKPKDEFPHTEDDYEKIIEKEKLEKEIAAFLGEKSDELFNLINTKDDAENK